MSQDSYASSYDQNAGYQPEPTQPTPGTPAPYPPAYPPPHPPAGSYHAPAGYPAMRVAPKNPGLALLVSFFVPGVGSMMNGDVGKGIGILVGYVVSVFLTIVLIGLFGMLGFWVWGMVDAYQGAKSWNLRHGILS